MWTERTEVRTRFGQLGAAGQTTVTKESSPEAASKLQDRLAGEKLSAGYEEKPGGPSGPSSERVTAPMNAKDRKGS